MILRADYLQNRFKRVFVNRKILKNIALEHSEDSQEMDLLNRRLKENLAELKLIRKAMKVINIKPDRNE